MKLLKIIKLNNNLNDEDIKNFKVRRASRAIVFDKDENIAILEVANLNYHKLPGGGVEKEEDFLVALKRECLEEIGCDIEVYREVGEIIEYRDEYSQTQHSYCYLAKVLGEKGEPNFTQKELEAGFKIKWVSLSEAIQIIKADKPDDYLGKHIQIRDCLFLEEAPDSK